MTLIDTHSHIYLPEFDGDREILLEKADKEGIIKIFMPAIDSKTHDQMLGAELHHQGQCFSMMGVHPCSVKENFRTELAIARDHLEKRPFKAIGETGLDFYWDKTFTNQQYEAFHQQAEWALHFDVPLVIHSRNSIEECIQVVAQHTQPGQTDRPGKLKGIFHCFSGTADQAGKIIELGFFLGIGGVLTFKNAGLDIVLREIPLEHIVLETDAPYLAPVPFRGKRNEPAYLKYVVEKLAEIKGLSPDEVGSATTSNVNLLFGV